MNADAAARRPQRRAGGVGGEPAGLVELSRFDDRWAGILGECGGAGEVVIRPDLDKLDLSVREFVDLDDLRADDSGRSVGPKAAKLGGLRPAFPEAVAPGVAIPFGIFKAEVLDRPYQGEDRSVFDWMVAQYQTLASLPPGSAERTSETEAFRAELYQIILATEPSAAFRTALKSALERPSAAPTPGSSCARTPMWKTWRDLPVPAST